MSSYYKMKPSNEIVTDSSTKGVENYKSNKEKLILVANKSKIEPPPKTENTDRLDSKDLVSVREHRNQYGKVFLLLLIVLLLITIWYFRSGYKK